MKVMVLIRNMVLDVSEAPLKLWSFHTMLEFHQCTTSYILPQTGNRTRPTSSQCHLKRTYCPGKMSKDAASWGSWKEHRHRHSINVEPNFQISCGALKKKKTWVSQHTEANLNTVMDAKSGKRWKHMQKMTVVLSDWCRGCVFGLVIDVVAIIEVGLCMVEAFLEE